MEAEPFLEPLRLLDVLGRLLLACLLGGVLGWEREARGKPAGLRTHMMLALGAAAFTVCTLELHGQLRRSAGDQPFSADALRAVEAVVAGVGFLGAGTIIRARGSVRGLTTAATLWVAGSIGLACGAGFHLIAGLVTVPALVILSLVGRWEAQHLDARGGDHEEDEERARGE